MGHQASTCLLVGEMEMHGFMDNALGKAQVADSVLALGEGYEYQVAPSRLAMANVIAWLGNQRMNGAHGCCDDRGQVRDADQQILDSFKPVCEAGNGSRIQALVAEVGQYLGRDGPQSVA